MTLLVRVLVLGCLVCPVIAAGATLRLQADTELATAGYFQLQWDAGGTSTRLVESRDSAFEYRRVVYEGPDTARLMSGKGDGDYYYRLEEADAESSSGNEIDVVSNTLKVTVRHHSLSRAITFFAIGAAVFLATLTLVLVGGHSERRQ